MTLLTESCSLEFTVAVQWWHVILGIGIPVLAIAIIAGLVIVAIVMVRRYRNLTTRFHNIDRDDQAMIDHNDGVRSDE